MIDFTSPTARRIELIAGIALVVIVLGLVAWYMATHQGPQPYGEAIVETATTSPALAPQTYEESDEYYAIEATYPAETALSGNASMRALVLMEAFVDESVLDFKRQGNFDNLTQADIELLGLSESRKQTLFINYDQYAGPATISYAFLLVVDTLGAHPNSFYRTFTFNRATGSEVPLEALFIPRTNYLTRLSAISEFQLAESVGEFADLEYIRQGITPEAINFQSFVIEGENLVLIFPPYQVAPYAAGTQRVTIPLADLSEVLRLEYRPQVTE